MLQIPLHCLDALELHCVSSTGMAFFFADFSFSGATHAIGSSFEFISITESIFFQSSPGLKNEAMLIFFGRVFPWDIILSTC